MTTTQRSRHGMREDAKDRLIRMTDEARTRFKRRGGELLEDAQDQGERVIRTSRSWISKNPAAAVSYAFLAGVGVSLLFRRVDRSDY